MIYIRYRVNLRLTAFVSKPLTPRNTHRILYDEKTCSYPNRSQTPMQSLIPCSNSCRDDIESMTAFATFCLYQVTTNISEQQQASNFSDSHIYTTFKAEFQQLQTS